LRHALPATCGGSAATCCRGSEPALLARCHCTLGMQKRGVGESKCDRMRDWTRKARRAARDTK
jgi:hypothetical protein